MVPKPVLVDVDCGVDDALALMLVLKYSNDWKLVGITCCHGNTSVENVCRNVKRLLNHLGAKVPVFKGAHAPLLPPPPSFELTAVHGQDGLGDIPDKFPPGDQKTEEEPASMAMVRLAKKHRGQMTLVVLGPLTNVALALRLDQEFGRNLKKMVIMGGNSKGIGNVTAAAEQNFMLDALAAKMVLKEVLCPITIMPWEVTRDYAFPWEYYEYFTSKTTKSAEFVRETFQFMVKLLKEKWQQDEVELCDFLAMAVLVDPLVLKKVEVRKVDVETSGEVTQGLLVVDRRDKAEPETGGVRIVTKLDVERLQNLLEITLGT